ncbi:hypothetical protein T06_4894 [Trichinella sp. T6]|nr:hypothetical protein T06_4894 [Trichinella sp. T6]
MAAAAAARSLRKYGKHASSCFIQCCVVFVVRRSDVAAGACVFFTLPTSLRRQGGIFRCPKISRKAAMIACRYVRWLINLLQLQLPRASKRSVKRLIQPFRQYPLQEMFEGRFVAVAVAVAAGVVATVVGFQGKSKRKKQYPSVFETLRFYPLFNIAVAGEEEHGIFTAASK